MTPSSAALIALLIQQSLFALMWLVLGALRMSRRAAWIWAAGVSVAVIGLALLLLRAHAPAWLGFLGAFTVLSGGFLIMLRGLQVFCRTPPDRWLLPAWVAMALALGAAQWQGLEPLFVTVSSLPLGLLVWRAAWVVRRDLAVEFGRRVAAACAWPFWALGGMLLLRGLIAPLAPDWVGSSLHAAGDSNLAAALAFVASGLVLNLALVGLVCSRLVRRLEQASEHDALTGLLNRRGIESRLHQHARLAARRGQCMSLLSIDADHFKRINDEHGHPAGDAVLQALGQVLRSVIRGGDLAARAGGEEFWVLMPDTGAAGAAELAQRVLLAMRAMRVPLAGQPLALTVTVTVSIGVVTAEHPLEAVDIMMRRLDAALYRAKKAGRNRVAFGTPEIRLSRVADAPA